MPNWAEPRPKMDMGMHTTENDNRAHIPIELAASAMKMDNRTPAQEWFQQIEEDIRLLDQYLNELYQKLQPALTPGYHGETGEDEVNEKAAENSNLVEQLKRISTLLNYQITNARIVTRRIEL